MHVRVRVGLSGHVYVADWVRRSSHRLRASSLLAINGTVVQLPRASSLLTFAQQLPLSLLRSLPAFMDTLVTTTGALGPDADVVTISCESEEEGHTA